ncbi:MAG TPA: hypothetical protein VJ868_08290 [Actinomycetota bacterium]|nr:hypothetical protein [Actinomycetota bacterium]
MPPSRWISLTLAFALILPACDSQGSARPRGELATALDALCEARMLSARGRIGEAEATFTDRAHAFLHRLARQTNRASAAELLEAKARVEQAFLEPPPPAALARLLETLRRRTAEAGEAEVPPCR